MKEIDTDEFKNKVHNYLRTKGVFLETTFFINLSELDNRIVFSNDKSINDFCLSYYLLLCWYSHDIYDNKLLFLLSKYKDDFLYYKDQVKCSEYTLHNMECALEYLDKNLMPMNNLSKKLYD